jgi:hypothetical protein
MLTFMTAYNADDEAQLDRLFAPAGPNLREGVLGESGFVELTRSNQRLGTTGATERAGLLPYVAARHRAHEQLLLLWIEAAPHRRTWPARAQITYELNVRANDLPGGTRLLWGKGELNCASRTIPAAADGSL